MKLLPKLRGCMSLFAICGAHAEWKPEYAQLSQETRYWYKKQELNPEARERLGVGWKSCCEPTLTCRQPSSGANTMVRYHSRRPRSGWK